MRKRPNLLAVLLSPEMAGTKDKKRNSAVDKRSDRDQSEER